MSTTPAERCPCCGYPGWMPDGVGHVRTVDGFRAMALLHPDGLAGWDRTHPAPQPQPEKP